MRASRKNESTWNLLQNFIQASLKNETHKIQLESKFLDDLLLSTLYFGENAKAGLQLSLYYRNFIVHWSEIPELANAAKQRLLHNLQIVKLFFFANKLICFSLLNVVNLFKSLRQAFLFLTSLRIL
jgi:hypothetical protein